MMSRNSILSAVSGAVALCLAVGPSAGPVAQTVRTVKGGETVAVAGVPNILVRVDKPKGSILLLTGGNGRLNVGDGGRFADGGDNALIRNRDAFAARGYNVLLVELGTNLAAAVEFMAGLGRPVVVVGTSKGTQRAAQGLAAGARPDKLVLTSGFLSEASGPAESVAAILGTPRLLPPTLVVHHRDDHCRFTRPAGVAPFQAWAGGRVEVTWLSGGTEQGNPCRFSAHHGFGGQDAALVSRIAEFAGR